MRRHDQRTYRAFSQATFTLALMAATYAVVTVACAHTASFKISSSINVYYARLSDYKRLCQAPVPGPTPECGDFEASLLLLHQVNNDAAQANLRGGALAVQLEAVAHAQDLINQNIKALKAKGAVIE